MRSKHKSHVKHRFNDTDEKGNTVCKFVCQAFWASQFHALRRACTSGGVGAEAAAESRGEGSVASRGGGTAAAKADIEEDFVRSLGVASRWDAKGGKSGATFSKTADGRFVVKYITKTELQMFLDIAPQYFEYMTKALFYNVATVLCKIVGVYQIGFHNRITGKRSMEQVGQVYPSFIDRE
ncbi:unnamed protein product, partial [Phaeothamnion confervicola]